ncbi:MAG: VPLPA-CTERM sorting domain-containing protein [Pseudomonadota bacterium]
MSASAALAVPVTIDSFDDAPPVSLSVTVSTPLATSLNDVPTGTLFNDRDTSLTFDAGSGSANASLTFNDAQPSLLTLSTDTGVGASATIVYSDTGGGTRDLEAGGNNAFGFSFGVDQGFFSTDPFTLSVQIVSASGTSTVDRAFANDFIGDVFFFYDEFVGSADISTVSQIRLILEAPNSADAFIDTLELTNIPVPAALPLMALGLGALVVAGRRRRDDA